MLEEKPPEERERAGIGAALSFGMTFTAAMVVFPALGWWIDQKRGGGQGFALAGIFLGLFYGGYELWKLIRLLQGGGGKKK